MRIGELSRKTNVSRDALRLYERRGLIQSLRRENGYRDYSEATVQLVEMIKLGQGFGFTLAEMLPEMRAIAQQGLGSKDVAALLSRKLTEIDARIADLNSQRAKMARMLAQVCPLSIKS